MWYWIVMGILILAIVVIILITVMKMMKENKDYNDYERNYNKRRRRGYDDEDDYDDDYDDGEEDDDYDDEDDDYDDDEDDEEDYEPRRPVRRQEPVRQPARQTEPKRRRWKIVLEDVDQEDQYSFIFYDSIGIGRVSASSDYDKFLSLPEDLRVSKVHCAIVRSGDRLYLRDEGSKNHTYLNGKMVQKPIVIQKEDVISVGGTRLEVVKILRETA